MKTLFKKSLITCAFSSAMLLGSNAALASNDINQINLTTQSEFSNYAESLTNVLSYKTTTPPELLGWVGFDLGVSYTQANSNFKLSDQSAANSHQVDLINLQANKGFPGGIDLNVQYSMLTDSSITSLTGELRYALIQGGVINPSVSVGGFYTKVSGVKALDVSSYGIDLGVSKGFANFTPYANIGWVGASIDPTLDTTLKSESPNLLKFNAGVNINFVAFDVLIGYQQVGELDSLTLKAGYRF